MAEPFTIYKLTVLYMLDQSEVPLSNSQLINFFLDLEYTDYFSIQEVIGNLVSSGFILSETFRNTTQYRLSASGKETLGFFRSKISEGIQSDVANYFEKNKWAIRQTNSVLANFERNSDHRYQTTCQVRSDGKTVLEIKLTVNTKDEAEAICRNWQTKNDEVFALLMDTLMQ